MGHKTGASQPDNHPNSGDRTLPHVGRRPGNGGLDKSGSKKLVLGTQYLCPMRPATAIILIVLLAVIAIAGFIQLWLILQPG